MSRARIAALLVALAVLAAGACGRNNDRDPPATSDAAGPTGAAVAVVAAPVDSTGLCIAHRVLASVCTQCNPRLAPVFQAKGDWCAEHGLPESFCPICHPETGGRPKLAVTGADEAPADGTKIRFKTKETARLAGIETVTAMQRTESGDIDAVARIVYDATRVAAVNARAPGVVRTIHVDVGSRVRRGTPLAVIESAAVGADQAQLSAARARVEVAEAAYQRTKDLHDKGIVPAKDTQVAHQELEAARAEAAATSRALGVVGAHEGETGVYELVAPLAGVVTRRDVSVGALVDPTATLFEIVDSATMWAEIEIRETDLGAVAVGLPVVVTVEALGDRAFASTIDYIAPAIDPRTRTATARARLVNTGGALRANMYGRARIAVRDGRQSVAVPRDAVQRAKGVPVVFVRLAEDLYETRRVQLGPVSGDLVALAGGVRPGELVVTAGSFLLKTETLKESIGAGCCEVEGK
jgi:cobalt-zinc-cadmium efflux system membrane fusion protein